MVDSQGLRSWKLGDRNRTAGFAIFTLGAVSMAVSSLLPWFLHPLYIRYGWTMDFVEHVWPQTLIGNTPVVVLVWILALPAGVIFAILGGLIYTRDGKGGA